MYTSEFNNVKIILDSILERDMDHLIIEEFISNKDFASIFLNEVGIDVNSKIISVQRSLRFNMGESDIVIVLESPEGLKLGLHIEDKVNALAMQEQYGRYEERAVQLKEQLGYTEHRICITAPQAYLNSNDEARKYPFKVSYEKIKEYFETQNDNRSKYKLALLNCVLGKRDNVISIVNDDVTSFWDQLEQLANERGLCIVSKVSKHGKESKFIRFKTSIPKVWVVYKARHGHVDLQFPNMKDKLNIPNELLSNDMKICNANKSGVVRISNPKWALNLEDNIHNNINYIFDIFNAVSNLIDLSYKLKL